jgi:hypothetical protein
MGNVWETEDTLNFFHVTNIFDEFPVMLVPEIFEENKDKQLMPGVRLLRILTGIWFETS